MDFKEVFEYTKLLSVLYVEDEELILEHSGAIFATFFDSVTKALDGQEGINKYKEYKDQTGSYFDIVITDIQMPNKNGLEMIEEIKEINNEQAIIVTSAHNESTLLISLIQQGITSFILKPFVNKQLLSILHDTSKNIFIKKENIQLEIEKQIQIEQKNNQHQKILAMADMIDNIAHQYRQPLSIISTTASSMKYDKEMDIFDESELINNCNRIQENAQYLSHVIDNFSSFVKDIQKKEFNLYELITDILNKHSRIIKEGDIEVVLNCEKGFKVYSQPSLLVQVIINILINAADVLVTQDNKRYIFIDINESNNTYIIDIKDNGGGIDEENISKVFDLYFSTKHKYIGTGLGLYIAYNIVTRQLGGSIEVENDKFNFNEKEYIGASFRLSIPKDAEE